MKVIEVKSVFENCIRSEQFHMQTLWDYYYFGSPNSRFMEYYGRLLRRCSCCYLYWHQSPYLTFKMKSPRKARREGCSLQSSFSKIMIVERYLSQQNVVDATRLGELREYVMSSEIKSKIKKF